MLTPGAPITGKASAARGTYGNMSGRQDDTANAPRADTYSNTTNKIARRGDLEGGHGRHGKGAGDEKTTEGMHLVGSSGADRQQV